MRKTRRSYNAILCAFLVVLCTLLVVVAYYINHPRAELLPDTWSYLYVVNLIQTHGQLVNFWRLPGYPLLIVGVYTVCGQGNVDAVSIVQGALFVGTVLEIYVIALLIMRHVWLAASIGFFVGTDVAVLSYVKPLMSEASGMFLLTTLALVLVLFLHTFSRRLLWLVTSCALCLMFTRPEWIFLPIPLFAYLLFVAAKSSHAYNLTTKNAHERQSMRRSELKLVSLFP